MKKNFYIKSHGLGNDYLFFDSDSISFPISPKAVQTICDVHFGIGSDGILLKVPSEKADFGLRIFNPDGSEAEKSGNGLRIFSKCLFDYGYTSKKQFSIETPGGIVQADIIAEKHSRAEVIQVDMGKAIFESKAIPVAINKEYCMDESLFIRDTNYQINCVSVGNPHCVILKDTLDFAEISQYGPLIESNAIFPNKINVQFARVLSDREVEILIWERGAGYTLASGSSSCAVASVLKRKKLTGNDVTVRMPGGSLKIRIDDDWNIRMTGEVRHIADGILHDELIQDISK